jgi:hypothetical protein
MTTTKKWMAILGTLLLVGILIYVYADWFRPQQIEIYHRIAKNRPMRGGKNIQNPNAVFVTFGLDRKCTLTEVKVLSVAALATNENPYPLWHLVSDTNSVPLKGFTYGERIRGMRPFVKGAPPQALESNVTYRLLITADGKRGQHDFSLNEK